MKSLLVFAVVMVSRPSNAWHEAGHRAIGIIAYEGLSPDAKAKLDDILANLPDANTPEGSVQPPDPFKELSDHFQITTKPQITAVTLDVASVWPDWIRRSWLDRPDWHYVNLSINGPGGNADKVTGGRAIDVIKSMVDVLRDPGSGKTTKAIALAWLTHVLGDIHQPLHAVAYFDSLHPTGDRGGNSYFLKPQNSKARIPNLHSFWDGIVGEGPEDVPSLVAKIKQMPAPDPEQTRVEVSNIGESASQWANESLEIARKEVYRIGSDGAPKLSANPSEFNATSYRVEAEPIAYKRVQLAALRLRSVLEAIFGK